MTITLYCYRDGEEHEVTVAGSVSPRVRASRTDPAYGGPEVDRVLSPVGFRLTDAEHEEALMALAEADMDAADAARDREDEYREEAW